MAAKAKTTKTQAKTTKAAAKPAPAKAAKAAKAVHVPATNGKMTQIQAALKVLGEAKGPMNTKDMVAAMEAKKYWTSPGGKTPAATLYSAILRELGGKDSRFKKVDRGQFALS